ncbi:MAG: VOC family protein [Spirochaetaceae bacterium]|jgi:predicted enzyme related to lactoylglutathione lyase|nr:VOC family protein [Spirochaetaceae bacterium]
MGNKLGHLTILVKEYDEAIQFYKNLGMEVLGDNIFGEDLRWVSMAFINQMDFKIVFQKVKTEKEKQAVGLQAGDHVLLTIETENCQKEYERLKGDGVKFLGEPETVPWGIEVMFEDLYGNLFDLVQIKM